MKQLADGTRIGGGGGFSRPDMISSGSNGAAPYGFGGGGGGVGYPMSGLRSSDVIQSAYGGVGGNFTQEARPPKKFKTQVQAPSNSKSCTLAPEDGVWTCRFFDEDGNEISHVILELE